jgi:hypothetical protein
MKLMLRFSIDATFMSHSRKKNAAVLDIVRPGCLPSFQLCNHAHQNPLPGGSMSFRHSFLFFNQLIHDKFDIANFKQ